MNKVFIWLDDWKSPHNPEYKMLIDWLMSDHDKVVWIDNYSNLVNYINTHGLPAMISFDYDLNSGFTGENCMEYLVDYMRVNNIDPDTIKIHIHSSHRTGSERIQKIYDNYKIEYESLNK